MFGSGLGCKVAGFISVFSSELSIFTLTVITLERWYAITYAIHLNRRLKLGVSVKIMLSGWIYALIMASLPLVGISSYSKTSICLPMEHKRPLDMIFLLTILSINAVAFLLIASCYAKVMSNHRFRLILNFASSFSLNELSLGYLELIFAFKLHV